MTNVAEILEERGKTHGDFHEQASTAQALKEVAHNTRNWAKLTPEMREAIDMILHKCSRILNGDPSHDDTWTDLGGYSELGKLSIPRYNHLSDYGKVAECTCADCRRK